MVNVGHKEIAHFKSTKTPKRPRGCEAIVRAARQWMGRHRGDRNRLLVKLDMENAFNCLDREAMLEAVRSTFPYLAPWVDSTYGAHSGLWLDGHRLHSQRGVQQGDPLGPLLFSLALQVAIERVKVRAEFESPGDLDFMVFYLDDGTLAGPGDAVVWFAEELEKEFNAIGLSVNWGVGKSEAIPPSMEACSVDRSRLPRLHFNTTGCFTLLGAPIGNTAFCESASEERRQKMAPLLEALPDLEDPQLAYTLLKHCASFCKMSYSMRVVPRDSHLQAMSKFDNDVRIGFNAAVGVTPDDEAWKRARRPVSFAGLGLRSVEEFSDAAYIASVASSMKLAQAIDNNFRADDDMTCDQLRSAIHRVNEKLPECAHVNANLENAPAQKVLCAKLERGAIDDVLRSLHTPVELKAHTQLMSGSGSGAWLHATPCRESRTLLDAPLFRVAIMRRLRMPLLSSPSHCSACGMGLDIWADHALVCSCKGDRTIRHNALRNCAFRFARSSGLNPQKEKPGLLPPRPDAEGIKERAHSGGRRPADIWIPRWCDGGAAALDFAVTSGMRSTNLHRSAIDHTAAVVDYEASKRSYLSTASQCEQQGLQFLPVVVEGHGGTWGPTAKEVFKVLCRE